MLEIQMPYQCLERCGNVLLAARGSCIDTFNLEDKSLLSTWRIPKLEESATQDPATKDPATENTAQSPEDDPTPPAKRQKLSEPETEPGKGKQKQKKKKGHGRPNSRSEIPSFIALTSTRDCQHVIGVTGADKSIRVFKWEGVGSKTQSLVQISQRVMPKRPYAISISKDDSTVLIADKFGDVWSLPLLFLESTVNAVSSKETLESKNGDSKPAPEKTFKPAANNLTVHSVRNLKALENQKKHAQKSSEKAEPTFEKKLLLGHVSMLTDITLSTVNGRDYIITSDRDEHIRVSRGIPQAYVIENFCLGHKDFVSRLCIPKDRPEILISGGGDDELFVWKWAEASPVTTEPACKVNLKSHVQAVLATFGLAAEPNADLEPLSIAVSGICHFRKLEIDDSQDIAIAIYEGVPALFAFLLTSESQLDYLEAIPLPGNALAVATHVESQQNRASIVVSIDNVHKAASTSLFREQGDIPDPLLSFIYNDKKFELSPGFTLPDPDEGSEENERPVEALSNLLYGLENLRKSGGDGKDVEEG